VELQEAVSEIIRWRLCTSLYEMWYTVDCTEKSIPSALSLPFLHVSARSCVYWMNELAKIDKRLSVYFSAVALLHVARKVSINSFKDELMDILVLLLGHNFSQCHCVLSLPTTETIASELIEFLQMSAVKRLTTYRQSMAAEFAFIATIVTTDFEALYAYKRGDYQRCLQLSTQNVNTLLYTKLLANVNLHSVFFSCWTTTLSH